jgi:hypothetical protein
MSNSKHLQELLFDTADQPLSNAVDTLDVVSSRRSQPHHSLGTLPLLQLANWNEDNAYDEHPPTCIYYSIKWKLIVEKKLIAKETEPDLVLAPSAS